MKTLYRDGKTRTVLALAALVIFGGGIAVIGLGNPGKTKEDTVYRVGSDLRSTAIAIHTYYVDWNAYPPSENALTTPVAYMTSPFPDYFSEGQNLKIVNADQVFIYSVGPDGIDDRANLIYDPQNGIDSRGDMIWFINPDNPQVNGLYRKPPEPTPTFVMESRDSLVDEKVRSLVSRTRADLRSLHTAIESYNVDYNVYTENLFALTSPIAYMTSIPADGFAAYSAGGQWPEGYDGLLQVERSPDGNQLYLYGIGPDGVDDKGTVEYDPSNGTISGGDLRRVIDLPLHQRVEDPALRQPIDEAIQRTSLLHSAARTWTLGNDRFPDVADLIEAELIKTMPEDPFLPGNELKYVFSQDKSTLRIYSVGPDGDDDGGLKEIAGRIAAGEISDGDIGQTLELKEVLKSKQPYAEGGVSEPYLQALLAKKEETGRDNAMIYYVNASRFMPALPDNNLQERLDRIRSDGWNEEDAKFANPYLALWKPAFGLIRQGVALDYAEGLGGSQGPATPAPNFLFAQTAFKMLTMEGRKLESEGRSADALDNYLAALTMARDYGAKGNTLIGHLISAAGINIASRPLSQLARNRVLSPVDAERGYRVARGIDNSRAPLSDAMRTEKEISIQLFTEILGVLDGTVQNEQMVKDIEKFARERNVTKDEVKSRVEQALAGYEEFWDKTIRAADDPDFVFTEKEREAVLNQIPAPFRNAVPNFLEANIRIKTSTANLRMARIDLAIALYRHAENRAPESLAVLGKADLPKDPFTGHSFGYIPLQDSADYILYSTGPDEKEDQDAVIYDPTNGTLSRGDIFGPE